ncbi:MAG: head-tail connector protein [Bacteroides sp.]|jgi:hypothetical protein|nr:head-tail connector protein [Bacteroides sp.]
MSYVDLATVKAHLNIDSSYEGDDTYLNGLIEVAEQAVANDIRVSLDTLKDTESGKIPAPLRQAILLFIGQCYANREPVAFAAPASLPLSYNYLLDQYRNYSG